MKGKGHYRILIGIVIGMLCISVFARTGMGMVKSHQKISDTAGNFTGDIDSGDIFGYAVASLGDLDDDGVNDIAVGAYGDDDGGDNRGAVWILFLNADGSVKSHQKISDTQGGFNGTLLDRNSFGCSITSLGDLNGDGVTDIAVGAYTDDEGGTDRGAVWILFLNSNGTVKSHQKISDLQGNFTGILSNGDFFGCRLSSIGDLNNDGVTDIAVSATGDDDGGDRRGAIWILFLNADGTVKSHQKISDTQGGFTGTLNDLDQMGISLTSLGDFDKDGITDIACGTHDDDGGLDRGAVWILFLNNDGTVKSHQKISDTEGNFTGVLDDDDRFGSSIVSLNDKDGDGVTDLAVGARKDDDGGTDRGAVWILYLNGDGTVKNHVKISDTEGNFDGDLDNEDLFGISIDSLGDLNDDGEIDLATGAYWDDDGGSKAGAVWVLFLEEPSLMVHLELDESSGGVAGDSSGNGRDGTLHNMADDDWVEGRHGNALDFDGVDDYVEIESYKGITGSNPRTCAAWIKTNSNTFQQVITWGKRDTGKNWTMMISDMGKIVVAIWGGLIEGNRTDLNDGRWHHIAAVLEEGGTHVSDVKVYIDGEIETMTCAYDEIVNTTADLNVKIGCLKNYDDSLINFFDGLIDDVRIYNYGLSQEEIREIMALEEPSLMVHLELDESSGGVAGDSSGNGRDGTLHNMADEDWVEGRHGNALDFDGVDDYVEIEGYKGISGSNPRTCAAWVKTTTTAVPDIIAWGKASGSVDEQAWNVVIKEDGRMRLAVWGGKVDGDTVLNDGRWHHIAAVLEEGGTHVSDVKLYVDGELENMTVLADIAINTTLDQNVKIGCFADSSGVNRWFFAGLIDDVRIYNHGLTQEEIRELSAGIIYHVDVNGGNDNNDGLARASALATIQKGIDTAQEGDTVQVWPGLYTEDINFKNKAITVTAAADAPVLQAQNVDAVSFFSGEGSHSVLEHFVITNSSTGVFLAGSSPTLRFLTLADNDSGIEGYVGADPSINHCILWDNGYDLSAGQVSLQGDFCWVEEELRPNLPGPVSCWTFDENQGSTAKDSIGINDGTIQGAIRVDGYMNRALSFDGIDDYVDLGNDNSLKPALPLTVSAWIKPARTGYNQHVIDLDDVTTNYYGVWLMIQSNDTLEISYGDGTGVSPAHRRSKEGRTEISADTWYHVVGVVRGATDMDLYINGINDGGLYTGTGGNLAYSGGGGRIGGVDYASAYYQGKIDDVRVYDRALSQQEVEGLYQYGLDNPKFADSANGDYHLRSEWGRFVPDPNDSGIWVNDQISSPCLDKGDPAIIPSVEPLPNGDRVNPGAFGNTPFASKSDWSILGDLNRDGIVNLPDIIILGSEWMLGPKIIPHGEVVVDGDLSEWPEYTKWYELDQVYYGYPFDIAGAKMALRWNDITNKIYAAVVVEDTMHVFRDDYGNWNASDRIEVYCQGDAAGGSGWSGIFDVAQQYAVGPNSLGDSWDSWGTGQNIAGDAGFESAVSIDGDRILYEIGVTAFDNYGGISGGDTTVTELTAGKKIGFDIVASTCWGSYFGMYAENLMTGKFNNADQFAHYFLSEASDCEDEIISDLNQDCIVNLKDLSLLVENWLSER